MIARTSLRWALILGATGFAAGFFGPMVLNPESNLGPIVGLLFSGPGGAVAGLVLGALFGALPVSARLRQRALILACVVLATATLYYCLPEPAVRGYVLDARVEACSAPAQAIDAALAEWESAVARVTWATPPADWKETAIRNVRSDEGLVLKMRIERKSPIYRHRRPWDRNRSSAGPWMATDESAHYYAPDRTACASYVARGRDLYWPAVDPHLDPTKPSKVWPPTDTLGFLRLQTLEPVPAEYRRLLH